jgi:AcrR family transcriptional regulator
MPKSSTSPRNRILQGALVLLERKGPHELSLREVARKAKISPMAPYKHFKHKKDLLAALCEDGFNLLLQDFRLVSRTHLDPVQRFHMLGQAYVEFVLKHPAQSKLMFGGFIDAKEQEEYPCVKAAGDQCFDQLVQAIEYGQHHGVMRKDPVDVMAAVIWSTIHGFSMLWMEKNFESTSGEQTDKMKNQLLDYISFVYTRGLKP